MLNNQHFNQSYKHFLEKICFSKKLYYFSITIGNDRKIIYQTLGVSLNIDCKKFKHQNAVKLTAMKSKIRSCLDN